MFNICLNSLYLSNYSRRISLRTLHLSGVRNSAGAKINVLLYWGGGGGGGVGEEKQLNNKSVLIQPFL